MMKYNQLIISQNKTAVALGLFDGVHLGHRAVISEMVNNSSLALTPTVFTFFKPSTINISHKDSKNIISTNQKYEIMENMGVNQIYCINFNEIVEMSPEEFIDQVLVKALKSKKIFCGFNYHFGLSGKANAKDLKNMCSKKNIEVTIIDPVTYQNKPISSTRIKKCIEEAKLSDVKNMLGDYFYIESNVVNGNKIGRKISIPTINQVLGDDFVIPKFGVYFAIATIKGKKYCGVTNIGTRPTVQGTSPTIETWIIGYNGDDLYGQNVKIEFVEYLRKERKFSSLEELKSAILIDAEQAKNIYKNMNKIFS